jgi:uncharacterized membrane protein YcaP (DUF421 family)
MPDDPRCQRTGCRDGNPVLIVLQFVITWLSVRSSRFDHLVRAQPRSLYFRGRLLKHELRRERVTQGELLAAAREAGLASLDQAEAVLIETNADLVVVRKADAPPDALADVEPPEAA